MNTIDVIFRHDDVREESLKGKVAIIIDVLRATSVMATALAHGAKRVLTLADVNEALEMKRKHPDLLLAGERNAVKLKGFDLGNSPLEMTTELLKGRDLLMCTTNGTQAIAAAQQAHLLYTAALINMKSVVDEIAPLSQDLVIICSGTKGLFSLDDGLAAGILVNRLMKRKEYQLTDNARLMSLAIKEEKDLKKALKECYHLKVLLKNGFQADVDYCLSLDVLEAVPRWIDGYFIL